MNTKLITKISAVFMFVVFTVSLASISAADDYKKFGVGIRGSYILLDEHIDNTLQDLIVVLHKGGRGVVDDAVAPQLDFEYFITKHISCELAMAASRNDIMFDNGGINAGSLWLFLPSVFIKYHPIPDSIVSPYFGFGMNVVMTWDEKRPPFDMKIDNSIGWAAKVGMDIPIGNNVYFNLDVMYYDTRHKINIKGLGTFGLRLDPFIIGSGIRVRF